MNMRLVDCFMELITYTTYFLATPEANQPSYDDTLNRYRLLFSRAEECVRKGGFSGSEGESALFAVCAWIDESLLCSNWSEREKWALSPLQFLRFNTTNAGEEFFRRLGSLGQDERNVREVFEYCIALGFRGRYFLAADEHSLREISKDNLSLLTGSADPEVPEKLFPGAYGAPIETGRSKKWLRLISPSKIPLIVIPVIAFIALFLLYRYMLDRMVSGFFGTGF